MSEIVNNKIEWTVGIPAHLQSINLYTKGAWLYGDEADETSQDLDMTKYVAENPEENIGEALDLLFSYAQLDGGHHKQWLLDQIVRTLTKENYEKFVKDYEVDPITVMNMVNGILELLHEGLRLLNGE